MHKYLQLFLYSVLLILITLTCSCGTISTEKHQDSLPERPFPPPYDGPKSRIQIIELGIPEDLTTKYPELVEKRVGWGMYEMIIDTLFESGRFVFLEEKTAIQERILHQWELSLSGLAAVDQVIDYPGFGIPEYLVYAQVFEFSTSDAETVLTVAAKRDRATIIGIQLRLVRVADGVFIPASGIGEAVTSSEGVWAPELDFNQSTVGLATKRAIRIAVSNLLQRMD